MKKRIFSVLLICCVSFAFISCGKDKEPDYTTVWPETGMGAMISPPESKSVRVWNTSDPDFFSAQIWSDTETLEESEESCNELVEECKAKGFTDEFEPDEKSNYHYKYVAFNDQGYKVIVGYNDKCAFVNINAPKKIGTYSWPTTRNAENLPRPESTKGTLEKETEDEFSLCVGDTSYEQFWEYIDKLKELGYEESETHSKDFEYYNYYRVRNANGDDIYVEYYGYNIMYIDFEAAKQYKLTE